VLPELTGEVFLFSPGYEPFLLYMVVGVEN
jgi:hypothetical protein